MIIKQEEEDNCVGEKGEYFVGVRIKEEQEEGPLPESFHCEECKLFKWEKVSKTGKVKYLPVREAIWLSSKDSAHTTISPNGLEEPASAKLESMDYFSSLLTNLRNDELDEKRELTLPTFCLVTRYDMVSWLNFSYTVTNTLLRLNVVLSFHDLTVEAWLVIENGFNE
ncbi:hypothetical protein Vadar_014167 [Vaccinium darrowii]|uniref:Uncharacterized protein n=1 Tax=Vaccinium darrowii TaxID=229202 RepID=A0ACB7ZCH4_9ERIC|nr:hypothetical protein Vadar_014167 [Vaccinium darrowii]